MTTVLKVSAKTNPKSPAGALAGLIREQGKTEIMSIGAGALNQDIEL
jgi:stage V sporulation protein S